MKRLIYCVAAWALLCCAGSAQTPTTAQPASNDASGASRYDAPGHGSIQGDHGSRSDIGKTHRLSTQ